MRNNRALTRAAGSLIHPLTLIAIVILLINDHLLRWLWPSWVWGKLGDFSWLIFFPFIPALILSLVVPQRWKNQEALVAGLSFALTALVFSSMNTVPAAHAAGLHLIQTILNAPFILRLDPTDLFALPGLLIGWHIWQQTNPDRQFKIAQAYPILALGALATIANMPYPPTGVECVYQQGNDTIFTIIEGPYSTYRSNNGGVSWQPIGHEEVDSGLCTRRDDKASWIIPNPENDQIQYRIDPDKLVYFSSDGGNTWELVLDLSLSQAELTYYENTQGFIYIGPGPLDALVDKDTGNLIMAMGTEGVLTRTPDGELLRFEIDGSFKRAVANDPGYVISLLRWELVLSVFLFLLVGNISALWAAPQQEYRILTTGIGSLPWIGLTLSSPAVVWMGVLLPLEFLLFVSPLLLLYFVFLARGYGNLLGQYEHLSARVFASSLIASLLFILPYILWSQDIIHKYVVAMILAFILTIGSTTIVVKNLVSPHLIGNDEDDLPTNGQ